MKLIPLCIVALFFLLIAPTSATPHDDAKNTAQGLIADLQGKLPYTAELTETQIENLGYIPDNKGTYTITIKSASYDANAGEAILYINAWRDGQSIKVNNPVHFYLPFVGGKFTGNNGAQRLQSAAIVLIRYLDAMPLGQPVNDDTSVIYAVNDTYLSQTSASDTWQNLRDGAGSAASPNQAAPFANRLAAHASTADRYTRIDILGLTIPTDTLAGKTITSGVIKTTYQSKVVSLGGSNETALIAGSPADPRAYVAGDYDAWDHTSPTEFAARVDYTGITSGNINFTLNAAGIAYINTTGDTVFYLVDGDVADNSFSGNWAAGASRYVRTKGVADATESNRPFGVFVWTAGGDITPPSSLSGMANTTNCSQTNITWTNPPDADFNHTFTMWQNVFDGNLSNTTTFRLKTGLTESTLYTLSTRACDLTGNCNTTWVNHSITTGACGVAPVAAFSANNLTVCQGTPTTFTDSSTNGPLTWLWDFGDSNTSALQNPQHTYDVIGLKTVNLTANNTYGSDYERKVNYINVTACAAPPTPTPTPTPTLAGCSYTNITTTIDENNTEWQAQAGNYTWGTVIINRTQGNISFYSCYATPTPTPVPPWQPEINPPSPDNLFGTVKLWIKEWLRDVFT